MVLLASNHLGCCVTRTATRRLEQPIVAIGIGQAEVDDFDVFALIKEQVLRFQISVANATPVNVLNAANYLLEKFARLCLLKLLALDDMVEEFSSAGILHDQEQLAGGFNDLCRAPTQV